MLKRKQITISKRYLYSYIHSSIFHNSQHMEKNLSVCNGWMDKENMVCVHVCACISIYVSIYTYMYVYIYIYNKILSRLKRKFYHCDNRWNQRLFVVQLLSCVWLFETPWTAKTRLLCSSPSPRACSNSCPLIHWCRPTILSSVIPFSYCPQSSPASRSFLKSLLFRSGSQSSGVSALASVLPMNIQDWFPLG